MPAEPTHAKLKRRASRKDLDEFGMRFDARHARELEQKRTRGEVSCAECRRLKIKCDKQIPCQSCQRRGCAALCPNGSLSTGQGTRFVLAATEHLHRRIGALSARIRLLEDALTSLQASHPLLHPDLLARGTEEDMSIMDEEGKERGERGNGLGERGEKSSGGGDVIDAFGTLSISDHGISRFFGPTGGVESLLISNRNPPPAGTSTSPHTPPLPSPHLPATASSSSPGSSSSTGADPLALFSSSFPFTPLGSPTGVQALVASHLPSRAVAEFLVGTYLQQCSWIFHGVTTAQLVNEMLPAVYGRIERGDDGVEQGANQGDDTADGGDAIGENDYSGPHDLALLFIIFAIGALVRPGSSSSSSSSAIDILNISTSNLSPPAHSHTQSHSISKSSPASSPGLASASSPASTVSSHITSTASNNALGEHYHQLARAALALQPVLEKPSLVTIQTLHLLSIYNAMSGSDMKNETSMEMTWSLITLAGHMSMTIGLHRDSARWGLTPKMVQRRRILFWDLFVADVWQSLNTGRPPSFSLAYIDCSFPDANDGAGEGAEAGFGSAFSTWQCRFAADCVADVTSRTLTAEAPTYSTIMELDKKVREFPLPEGMGESTVGGSGKGSKEEDLAGSFQRCVLDHIRETVLMYIHRSFFAQAIIEHPENPLKSVYAPSFLAAYRAASTILKSVREQFGIWPNSCARFWTMWTFAFSAAVVFGTVVTRGPRSPLAQSAMAELEQACLLFSKASVYSIRATKALPILSKLAEKARHALATAQNDPSSLSDAAGGLLWNVRVKQEPDEDDELAIFAGHTRFVSTRKPAAKPSPTLPYSSQRQQQIPASSSVNGWPGPLEFMDVTPPKEHALLPQSRHIPLHYPYAPSERSTCNLDTESFGPLPTVWDDERSQPLSQHPQQGYPQHQRQGSGPSMQQLEMMQPPRVVPSQFYPPPSPHTPQHPQHQYRAEPTQEQILNQQQVFSAMQQQVHPLSHAHIQEYHQTYPQHQHHALQQHHTQHQHEYPQHQHQQQIQLSGNAQLADLGLAARDSRLDERWSSFMQESGILEDIAFQRR